MPSLGDSSKIAQQSWYGRHAIHPLDETRDPWEKQPRESRKAYAAFALYRDMGPHGRSLAAVGRELRKSVKMIEYWSVTWQWQRRIEAWDTHTDQQRRVELERRQEDMLDRHRRTGLAMLTKVVQRLVGRPKSGDDGPAIQALDPNTLDAQDLARLAQVGVQIERLSHALPTEHQQITGAIVHEHTGATAILVTRILSDPTAALLAAELLERLEAGAEPDAGPAGENDTSGVGVARESTNVDAR